MRIWRISGFADLSGQGGVVAAARWNRIETPIVYCADHPASAFLEMLARIDPEDAPANYQLLQIDVPETRFHEPALPTGWRSNPPLTQEIGTAFINSGTAPVMVVPSAIVPYACNYLLNPRLLSAANIKIVSVTKHPIDARLLGNRYS